MFKGTHFEFRYRYLTQVVIFCVGFMTPWRKLWPSEFHRTWEALAKVHYQQGWMQIRASSLGVTVLGLLAVAVSAWLRTWGTAYLGAEVMNDSVMHGGAVMADGPYRHVRNPLYLGSWLQALALAMMMEPLGTIFVLIANTWMHLRLIGGEEAFLKQKLGAPYAEYCARVPRLLPSLRAKLPASGRGPRWRRAMVAEIYFISAAACYAFLFARYGAMLLPEHLETLALCMLGSLGVSLMADGVTRKSKPREVAIND
jgi:protein-S-isoprenylcysteine O-methyltransferase Ste14